MELLRAYAVFSLAASVALLLLPEGSLRRTAAFVIGLMSAFVWLQGFDQLLFQPSLPATPSSVLSPVSIAADEPPALYARALEIIAAEAAGCDVSVTLQADGSIRQVCVSSADTSARQAAAEVLGVDPALITCEDTR